MKLENYIPFMILLLIISILLIWYQNTFDSQSLQEKIERSDTSDLEEIYWNMQNNSTWKWEDLHNLWYLSYLIWNQKKENIDILQESYNYFLESFELWADLRTKHNLEVINKLLEQKNKIPEKREDSIEQEKEESPINPQNESQIPESSENTPEDEVSWENKPEDNNTSSWKQSEENQDEENDEEPNDEQNEEQNEDEENNGENNEDEENENSQESGTKKLAFKKMTLRR